MSQYCFSITGPLLNLVKFIPKKKKKKLQQSPAGCDFPNSFSVLFLSDGHSQVWLCWKAQAEE